jgi:hypothetical protein
VEEARTINAEGFLRRENSMDSPRRNKKRKAVRRRCSQPIVEAAKIGPLIMRTSRGKIGYRFSSHCGAFWDRQWRGNSDRLSTEPSFQDIRFGFPTRKGTTR